MWVSVPFDSLWEAFLAGICCILPVYHLPNPISCVYLVEIIPYLFSYNLEDVNRLEQKVTDGMQISTDIN